MFDGGVNSVPSPVVLKTIKVSLLIELGLGSAGGMLAAIHRPPGLAIESQITPRPRQDEGRRTMNPTDVRVLPAVNPGDTSIEPYFLVVETTVDEGGDTLTSISHVSGANEHGWGLKSLGHLAASTHAMARKWAIAYAADRGIPLVYERDETA